jgi:hypothetical protein
LISNDHVTTTSEYWSVPRSIFDQISGFYGDEFFFEVKGEDERAPRGVADELSVWDGVPFVGSEGGDGFSVFSFDNGECVLNIPAPFVKRSSFEIML